jgi:hypothetical protein
MEDIPTPKSVSPALWGRNTWEFLEMIVATYPRENPDIPKRDAVLNVIEGLGEILPCPECAGHYKTFISKEDLGDVISDRRRLYDFYYRLRADTAARTGERFASSKEKLWRDIMSRYGLLPSPVKTNRIRAPVVHPVIQNTRHTSNIQTTPENLKAKILAAPRRGCNCGK